MYVCAPLVCLGLEEAVREHLIPWDWKIQKVMSHHVGPGNQVLSRSILRALSTTEPFFIPFIYFLIYSEYLIHVYNGIWSHPHPFLHLPLDNWTCVLPNFTLLPSPFLSSSIASTACLVPPPLFCSCRGMTLLCRPGKVCPSGHLLVLFKSWPCYIDQESWSIWSSSCLCPKIPGVSCHAWLPLLFL